MYKKMSKFFLSLAVSLCAVLLISTVALAAPASGKKFTVTQPNGKEITLVGHGDEWFHWIATDTGYVVSKGTDGYWYYAQVSSKEIRPTNNRVGMDAIPKNAVQNKNIPELIQSKKLDTPKLGIANPQKSSANGEPSNAFDYRHWAGKTSPVVILLVNFKDIQTHYEPAVWEKIFFSTEGKTVRAYYDEVSNNQFQFIPASETSGKANDGVIEVTLDYNHPNPDGVHAPTDPYYYESEAKQKLTSDVLKAANEYIDFASYDLDNNGGLSTEEIHFVIIPAGYETSYNQSAEPTIWGHRWSLWDFAAYGIYPFSYRTQLDGVWVADGEYGGGYTMESERHGAPLKGQIEGIASEDDPIRGTYHVMQIGIVCHELGHDLGLPDTYDYGYDSAGVGIHSLMASGSWGALKGEYSGANPVHFDAFSKMLLGFVEPTVVETAGKYKVNSALTEDRSGNRIGNILKILTPDPNQFFLVENRQFQGFDKVLAESNKSGGILVEHIDQYVYDTADRINDDQTHKAVDVEEANEGRLGYSQLDLNFMEDVTLYDHYFYNGGTTKFNASTTPSSRMYNGSDSGVSINVLSKSGNTMNVDVTPSKIDVAAPVLESITPLGKASELPYNNNKNRITIAGTDKIVFTFNEKIKQRNFGDYQNLAWSYVYVQDINTGVSLEPLTGEISVVDNTIVMQLSRKLTPGYLYRLRLPAGCVTDLAGNIFAADKVNVNNPAASYFFNYYIVIVDDNKIAPAIEAANPEDDAIGVPVDASITLTFNEVINKGKYFNKISLKDSQGKAVAFTTKITNNVLTIDPTENLADSTKYTLYLPSGALCDSFNHSSKSYRSIFTTSDNSAATILSTSATRTSISIKFSEAISLNDEIENAITLTSNDGSIISVKVKVVGNTLYITPSSKLSKGEYTLNILEGVIKDLFDNEFDGYSKKLILK